MSIWSRRWTRWPTPWSCFPDRRRAAPGGLGSVHDSGGERSLLIDIADRVGVSLATLSQHTRDRLSEILDPGLEPDNPVDAWGTGREAANVFKESLLALASDDAVGVVAFSVDLTAEESPDGGYGLIPIEVASSTTKPVVVLGNLAGSIDPVESGFLRDAGLPVLRGTETGLRAIRHLSDSPRPFGSEARNRGTTTDHDRSLEGTAVDRNDP